MELRNAVYIGNDTVFAESLAAEMKGIGFTIFSDSSENLDFFQSTQVQAIFLETSACGHEVEPYLQWLNQAVDTSRCVIILLAENNDRVNYHKLLTHGVNDIYHFPVEALKVKTRVEILAELMDGRINQQTKPDDFVYKIPLAKRIFDIVMAGTALFLLSPIFIVVAVLIKLESRGPVFYASKRIGTGYRVFDFYKFRSMDVNADKKIKEMKSQNQYSKKQDETSELTFVKDYSYDPGKAELFDDKGKIGEAEFITNQKEEKEISFVKIKDDPRITKVGRFIRNTSIDELPQLINVLKGDMSIVGNRPIPLYEAELLTTDMWIERFIAPAGLTGLWQVEKRAKSTEMLPEERKMLDNEYARTYTFWKDIKIIFRTFRAVFQSETV
jgi:lipopolysaccharide/colanic/teichoic acid biosynthesis glycosyltransferase